MLALLTAATFPRPTLYDSYIALESTSISTKVPYFWTSIPWEGEGGLLQIAMSTGIINAKMEHGYTGINLNFADEQYVFKLPDQEHYEIKADSCCAVVCPCTILIWQALYPLFRTTNNV